VPSSIALILDGGLEVEPDHSPIVKMSDKPRGINFRRINEGDLVIGVALYNALSLATFDCRYDFEISRILLVRLGNTEGQMAGIRSTHHWSRRKDVLDPGFVSVWPVFAALE